MRKITAIFMLFSVIGTLYAQEDLINKVTQQAVEIKVLNDSLKSAAEYTDQLKAKNDSLKKSISSLESESKDLKKSINEKDIMTSQLLQKTDSLSLLKQTVKKVEKQITEEKEKNKAKENTDKILADIKDKYLNNSFDDLIKTSTATSVQNDKLLVGQISELQPILADLEKYYSAEEILNHRYIESKIQNSLELVNQINRKSVLLDNLKAKITAYGDFNVGMKELIDDIEKEIDTTFLNNDKVKKSELNKILLNISTYIFDYDFNFKDYPYLSEILLEIIKRKRPDPGAEISDLLKKL